VDKKTEVRFPAGALVFFSSPLYQGVYSVLVGRLEGKRPLGRPRRRWEDNVRLDLGEIGIYGANWIQLAQDRVQWPAFVNTVMNLRVP
jgi:hypothetical protein